MHHLSMQDPTDLEALFSAVSGAKSSAGTEEKIAEFDFAKAPVRKNSFWVMQLMGMGFQDKVGGDYRDEYFSGSTPVFSIIICKMILSPVGVADASDPPNLPQTTIESSSLYKKWHLPVCHHPTSYSST